MKHILPILTLTTLAAAASAQSAAAAGLSYNRAGVNYNTDAAAGDNGYSLSVEALVGSSNVWVGASADLNNAGDDSAAVGYLFKNVAAGIDATVSVGAGDAATNSDIGLTLRRSLSEVVAGLEARIVLGYNSGAGTNASTTDYTYELQYNINKQFGIAYSVTDVDAAGVSNLHTVSVRYNF
ncbi:MAG: hypothetical protein ACKO3A_03360 [Opitutia bacterium]